MALCSYYRILVRNSLADLEEGESIQIALFFWEIIFAQGAF